MVCFATLRLSAHTHSHKKRHDFNHTTKRKHKKHREYYYTITYNGICLDSVKTDDTTLDNFVKTWVGTRYVWGGSTKQRGVDCSGFTKILYKEVFNLEIPRTARQQYLVSEKIVKDSLESGDLIFFRTKKLTTWHVGVYLNNGYFIHASGRKVGVTISPLNCDKYIRIYLSGGKVESNKTEKYIVNI